MELANASSQASMISADLKSSLMLTRKLFSASSLVKVIPAVKKDRRDSNSAQKIILEILHPGVAFVQL
jgi:hypothetical protein